MNVSRTQQHRPPRRDPDRPADRSTASQFLVPVGLGVLATLLGVVGVCGVTIFAIGDISQPPDILSETFVKGESENVNRQPEQVSEPIHAQHDDAPNQSDPDLDTVAAAGSDEEASPQRPPQHSSQSAEQSVPVADPDTEVLTAVASSATADTPPGTGPLDDVRSRQRCLPIAGGDASSDAVPLCDIGVTDTKNCQLKLVDASFDDLSGTTLALVRRDEAGASFWDVSQETTTGLGRPERVGTFELKSGQLSFSWDRQAVRRFLPFCRLRITAGSGGATESETCQLWKPIRSRPAKMSLADSSVALEVVPAGTPLPPVECLAVAVELDDFPAIDSPPSMTVRSGSPKKIVVLDPTDTTLPLFSTELDFVIQKETHMLQMKHQAIVTDVSMGRSRVKIREDVKPFSKNALARMKSSAEKKRKSIEKRIRVIGLKIDKIPGGGDGGNPDRPRESLEMQRERFKDAFVKLADIMPWFESAEQVCSEIESDGRIKLRLYRQVVGGDDLDILVME